MKDEEIINAIYADPKNGNGLIEQISKTKKDMENSKLSASELADLRKEALQKASYLYPIVGRNDSHGNEATAEKIIADAEKFYAWLIKDL